MVGDVKRGVTGHVLGMYTRDVSCVRVCIEGIRIEGQGGEGGQGKAVRYLRSAAMGNTNLPKPQSRRWQHITARRMH